jgi:hypothetical protein
MVENHRKQTKFQFEEYIKQSIDKYSRSCNLNVCSSSDDKKTSDSIKENKSMMRWIGLIALCIFVSQVHAQSVNSLDSTSMNLLKMRISTTDLEKLIVAENTGLKDESIQSIPSQNSITASATTSTRWFPLGTGMSDAVWAIAAHGSDVYVGGLFSGRIAKWNGSAWQSMGSGISGLSTTVSVYAIAVDSPSVYAGGSFSDAGGESANAIARWDGAAWHALGSGLSQGGYAGVPSVQAIAVSGGSVYVGGAFSGAGAVQALNIARWNGTSWEALGNGLNGSVRALTIMNGNLYAAGSFDASGTTPLQHMAMWNGSEWQAVGGGMNGDVYALAVKGTTLYAGGVFSQAGTTPVNSIASWNGVRWDSLGSGITLGAGIGIVNCLAISESDLFAGGFFYTAGGRSANNVAKWDGLKWVTLSGGVNSMVLAASGSGINAYFGGSFTTADGGAASRIARYWNVGSTDLNLAAGWSLVSVPRYQLDFTANTVFSGKFGDMFVFNATTTGYELAPMLMGGLGYWVYYINPTVVTITGLSLGPVTIPCQAGWNLIGSQDLPVQLSSIVLTNGATIFGGGFRYNALSKSYEETTVITPGEGVWIYVLKACSITLPG